MYAKNPQSVNKKPEQPNKPKQTRSQRESWLVYGGAIFLAIAAFVVTFQFVEPAPPKTLTIASGSAEGAYHQYALRFQESLAQYGVELKIRTSSGSVENLELLNNAAEDVQLAFVQSGIPKVESDTALYGLGSLYLEPVWVFIRNVAPSDHLKSLSGLRVGVGSDGSGTQTISMQLLKDNGLLDSINVVKVSGSDAVAKLKNAEIDALISVGSHRSETVRELLVNPEFSIMSFSRSEAYALRYGYLSKVSLPEGSIDLANNSPDRSIQLVAPAATLISRENLHPALSDLVMQISSEIFSSGELYAGDRVFPSKDLMDYPLSSEAERFYKSGPPFLQRYLPFWAATLVDRLKVLLLPLIALLLPLSKILPPTYRWTVRKKIYQWYEELQLIDQSSYEIDNEENLELCLANLDKIEHEARDVEVPLGYANELYMLRQHIDLLARQIGFREKQHELARLREQNASKNRTSDAQSDQRSQK